jgi:hypothetical protein
MITLLKKSGHKETFWKNGKGKTRQIAIFPAEADISKNNFLWRISSAIITTSGPFSQFVGFKRHLVVWRGLGLSLNTIPLMPFRPTSFNGETEIFCEKLGDEDVIDLGVIYDPKKVNSTLVVLKYSLDSLITLPKGIHFFFLAKGNECWINDQKCENGDTIKIEQMNSLNLRLLQMDEIIFFVITINHL